MLKTIINLLFFLLFSQLLSAQAFSPPPRSHQPRVQNDTINQVNDNGERTGFWTDHFNTGNPRYTGYFKDGQPVGKFTYYFPEGRKRAELIHIEEEETVQATFFHRQSRTVMAEGQFVNQNKHGLWRFFDERGNLLMKNFYHNDDNHGVWKTFYQSGRLMETTTYHYGEKQGEWIQYYENGNVRISANYDNDMLNGNYLVYYESGRLMIEGYYNDNVEHKKWTYLSQNGEIEKILIYDEGTLIQENIFIEPEDVDAPTIRPMQDPYKDIFEGLF